MAGPSFCIVVPRRRAWAWAVVSGVVAAVVATLATTAWHRMQMGQRQAQLDAALHLVEHYVQALARDAAAFEPLEPALASPESSDDPLADADVGAAPQPTAPVAAAKPADNAGPSPARPGAPALARLTMQESAIARIEPDRIRFRSGAEYRLGQTLPSGAVLVATDVAAARVVTDRRVIEVTDYHRRASPTAAPVTATSASAAPAPREPAPRSPQRPTLTGQASAPSKPPTQAAPSSAMPPTQSAPPAAPVVVAAPATPAPAEERVSMAQANIAAIDSGAVRFQSGLVVALGQTFPSGERLLSVSPADGRIVTDRRVIVLKEAQP